ncbi:MAG: caspase family protein [Gemmataceae bacterium]
MLPKNRALWCVAVAVVWLTTPETSAQLVRLANDEPEIRLEVGGRSGVCDVLSFTAEGNNLLAVGEDKVVHRWDLSAEKLRRTRPLFWNTFREQRGAIYALALFADRELPLVAIGGNGKLNADVAIFDLRSGELLGAVTALTENPGDYERAGAVVWALGFHPAGKELAIGDGQGNVWVTPLVDGKPITAKTRRVVQGADRLSPELRVVWVGYLPDGRLAYAKRDGSVRTVGGGELFNWGGAVDKVVASADGRRLAARPAESGAKSGSRVSIRSLPRGDGEHTLAFRATQFPDRIALNANGTRVAVSLLVTQLRADGAANLKSFVADFPAEVQIFDLATPTPKVIASRRFEMPCDALAFHPDGKRLATADSLDDGTTLWNIEASEFRMLDRNTNVARQLWAVGMTADGTQLCFKDHRNPDPHHPNERADPNAPWITFNLGSDPRGWSATKTPVPPERARGAWTVTFRSINPRIRRDEFQWYVVEAGTREEPLPTNPLQDDAPRCYTFLPPGPSAPPGSARLAVGHAWGASVFDLIPGKAPRRVRKLNGHAGYVTSIAPAFGGKGLVTCSRDHTICIWNLADFPSEPLLGAAFGDVNGKIVVKSVDLGSPAQEAGLSVGDEVTEYKRGDSANPVPRERWLAEFRDTQPYREMQWLVNPIGRPVDDKRIGLAKTLLLHRPAARFLPLANNEWVLYSYRQCYYDCSANGDQYIQWLVSKDRTYKAPEVFGVEQFRKFLNQPEKVSDVVTKLVREPAKPLLPELFPPTVTLKADAQKVVAGQNLKVTVTVIPRARQDGKVNPVSRVELWLNGHHRVGIDTLQGKKFEVGVPFEVTFTVANRSMASGENRLNAVGVGFDDPGTGSGAGVSSTVRFTAAVDRPGRRLFVIAAGIRFFEKANDALGRDMDLPGATRDAARMSALWEQVQKTGGYDPELSPKPVLLLNDRVTKERLLAEIKEVGKTAHADDILVVCLAGHGAMFASETKATEGTQKDWYYIIPRIDDKTLLDVPDYRNPEKFRKAFVRDAELAEALINLDCQPLVFIDCCHSGAASAKVGERALTRNQTRGFLQNGFGPVVVAACAPDQLSWETGDTLATRGGLFSRQVGLVLGEKFNDADKNQDGALSVQEFFLAVQAGTEKGATAIVDELGEARPSDAADQPGAGPAGRADHHEAATDEAEVTGEARHHTGLPVTPASSVPGPNATVVRRSSGYLSR